MMKKIFLYALMLFSGFSCISCSDDEKGMANIDKKGMTMLIIVKQRDRMAMIFIFIGME